MLSLMKEKLRFTDIIFIISIFLVGGFNEHFSCLLSCVFSAYLFLKIAKKGKLVIEKSIFALSITLISSFYFLTLFWAIDFGMAIIGFLKFLPVFLYMVLLWQDEKKSEILSYLPYVSVVLVVFSAIGAQIPVIKDFFVVSGRFAGFFQYPNTFALFLLISELLIFKKSTLKIYDYISMALLIGGIFYTGSRTVFILFLISNFAMFLLVANKKIRNILLLVTAISAVVVVAIMFLFKDNAIVSRYLNISFGASTFVGRILYFVDALPLLIKYPLGMGYMGYFYSQHSIQTGIYNVTFVHNDFLQLFLDIGFIPAVLFIAAIVMFLFKKGVPLSNKLIVLTFVLHTLFDFNLQYLTMFFLLLLLMQSENEKTVTIQTKFWLRPISMVALLLNAYMFVALFLSFYNFCEAANKMYPYNTRNSLTMMEEETDLERANDIADKILKQNEAYFAPYSVKSKYAYTIGDFAAVIENKTAAIERYPFKYSEYKEFCVMLINGVAVFTWQNDTESVEVCNSYILSTYEKFERNKDRLSDLGSKITEQPNFDFSKNVTEYVNKLKEEQVKNK